ncbi:hypothetical protein DM558_11435 [Entomomonas moraniae]|uniref:Lipoprotein n=1 Tax=Entomomonas moraniae TaxID=2213226 RepID=A0A3S9XFY7_9GAMM|nr:lipoprotein [Entomomonas moraniae]AZS51345.1 hypothetical protein DM558_11435 [Entomomonas moraniae]
MKSSFLSIIMLTVASFMLAACGQKGPLYLPEKQEQPIITTQPSHTNTTQQEIKKTEAVEDTQ